MDQTEYLLNLDKNHVWHPYSSFGESTPVYPVASAHGSTLVLEDGRELLDGMASWWCVIHGYNHPVLNQAVRDQLDRMAHVMFGGLTHQPAVELAKLLVDITPAGLDKVFFSDSGSVAVEVSLKMALQYWHSQRKPQKNKFLSLLHGYHGDTFGAMSVCDPVNGMHHLFANNLIQHHFVSAPPQGFNTPLSDDYRQELEKMFSLHHHQLAAMIIEPIVQGAGGMRIYSPGYLTLMSELCHRYDVLLIADEIATGFGRTGKLFACEHAAISPDILCLGKGITGGYMTLAATLCSNRVAQGICQGDAGVFMHGPTFMANPLATATALASTKLLLDGPWMENIERIQNALLSGLTPCRKLDQVADVRVIGGIGVVEMKQPVNMEAIQRHFVSRGVWIRPFGKLVYVMPPYVMSNTEIEHLTSTMTDVLTRNDIF